MDFTKRNIDKTYRNNSTKGKQGKSKGVTIIKEQGTASLDEARKEFLSKVNDDTAKGIISFERGLKVLDKLLNLILTSTSLDEATDESVMTAKRVLAEIKKLDEKFLHKDKADQTSFLLKLLGGAIFGDFVKGSKGAHIDTDGAAEFASAIIRGLLKVSDIESTQFTPGMLGTGFALKTDTDGSTSVEADYLTVRRKAIFNTISIHDAEHIGGELVISPAALIVTEVKELTDGWQLFFNNKDSEGREVFNEFKVDDMARCRTFNVKTQADGSSGDHYWWRLVTARTDNSITVSKSVADSKSDIPKAGDNVSQLGNRTDRTRQNAQILSAYGTDAPSRKMYQGINSFDLTDKMVWAEYYDPTNGRMKSVAYGDSFIGDKGSNPRNYMSYSREEGLRMKGHVHLESGSSGWENIEGLSEELRKKLESVDVGAVNLLRNTGFIGDYKPMDMSGAFLEHNTDVYSPPLTHWNGSASVINDEASTSKRAVQLGNISQSVSLIPNETYTVSFKAKGSYVYVGTSQGTRTIYVSGAYDHYQTQFVASANTTISFSGSATICEIKLERGTVATDWCPAREDSNKIADEFRKLWYLLDALDGMTTIDGGLVLTSIIRLGQYADGVLQKVNACLSGIYNDDNDVFACAGGDMDKAINTVAKFRNNPSYQPTPSEMQQMCNFVITHGGLAIMNNAIVRGCINATSGVFRNISSPNGNFMIDEDGNLWAWDGYFNGTIRTTDGVFSGRIVNPWVSAVRQRIDSKGGIDIFGFHCPIDFHDRIKVVGIQAEDIQMPNTSEANGRDIIIWNQLTTAIDKTPIDTKAYIPSGCSIIHDGIYYGPSDTFIFKGNTMTFLTGTPNGWVVTKIVDMNLKPRSV